MAPTADAPRCLISTSVPTVIQPGARCGWTTSPEVSSISRIIIGVANTIGMPASRCPTVRSTGTTSVRSALMPTLITSRASTSDHLQPFLLRVDLDVGAVRYGGGDVLVKPREHRDLAERRTLRQDRIDRVEH